MIGCLMILRDCWSFLRHDASTMFIFFLKSVPLKTHTKIRTDEISGVY